MSVTPFFEDEQQKLALVRELLARPHDVSQTVRPAVREGWRPPNELRRADLELILPGGWGAAYALDDHGHVAGFKFGTPPFAQELFDLVVQFPYLQRLVFHVRDEAKPVDIPKAIGDLSHLRFVSLLGGIRSLPEDILRLSIPIVPADDELHRLLRKTIELVGRNFPEFKSEDDIGPTKMEESLGDLPSDERAVLLEANSLLLGIFLLEAQLEDPPIEIAARGTDVLASYFRERVTGALQLNEVKVLLVGNGSCGKTSLVKQLFGEKFDPSESQTHGINIRTLKFGSKRAGRTKANFWDFGGQEIMHATHQFFLSKRSVYVLVLDGRKEEDAEYWLQHILSFGGDSSVIVVLNKIDDHPAFDVNRRFLMSKYPTIAGFVKTSCARGTGIGELRDALQKQVAAAPILQTTWPTSWFNVKRRLERLESNYISVSDYGKICEEEKVSDQASRDALVEFLNDLGVILHFKDLQLLDTHVLDPRWVTEGVYKIINSEVLADQRGLLKSTQLDDVFKPKGKDEFRYSPEKYSYIVELMLKFELCYKLDGNSILVPDLLDIQEPEFKLEAQNALRFVFEYQYLPKSVMPRFIVRMHRDIRANRSWRTGAELEDKDLGVRALIRSDEKAKRIYVSVSGQQKRDYFAIIRKVISDINASFEKLDVTELVPLPDAPEVLIEYRELIGYELDRRGEIFVGKLRRAYSVSELLNGIEDEKSRREQPAHTVINVGNYIQQSRVGSIASFTNQGPGTVTGVL